MICELLLRLVARETASLTHANHVLSEFDVIYYQKSRLQLFEMYTRSCLYYAKHGLTTDTELVKSLDEEARAL